jgi:DnaJ-domain-containing protein 1
MQEHPEPNYETYQPRKAGWWTCQLCGFCHFHEGDSCRGCGTPKATAIHEPPTAVLEPLWRNKEEKRHAAEAAYRDWCRAESLAVSRKRLVDRISPARRAERGRRAADYKAKKAAYYRASAEFHEAGRKYQAALLEWQYSWASAVTNAKTLLGVGTNAGEEEIKSAYRRAVKLYHPDRAGGNGMSVEEATTTFRRIQEAYEILSTVFMPRPRPAADTGNPASTTR